MSCPSCGDKGVIRVRYHDGSPDDYAICLCAVGLRMRDDTNGWKKTGYALWQVWAAREQIDPSRVWLLEELSTAQEIADLGFGMHGQSTPVVGREAALLAAGKTQRAKL